MKKNLLFLIILIFALRYSFGGEITRAQQFIVMGYEGIRLELSSQEGPYIQTLIDLLAIPSSQRVDFVEQLKVLQKSEANIMNFSDQVVALGTTLATPLVPVPLPMGDDVFSAEKLEGALVHLTKGMRMTVITKNGSRTDGTFEDYVDKKLWIRGASKKLFHRNEILAIQSSDLK